MEIATGIAVEEQLYPAAGTTSAPSPARPVGAAETGFAQSIQDAAGQAGRQKTALGTQPRTSQPPTYENLRAQAGALPGVTPLTAGELGLRATEMELQTRQAIFNWAKRVTSPTNIADYPPTAVTYAGHLAAQVNHAGFAMPNTARAFSAPRRGTDLRSVEAVDDRKSVVTSLRSEI